MKLQAFPNFVQMKLLHQNKAYVCCKCGKLFISNIVTVTESSRKNKRGRIAWGRDAVCVKCQKKESEGGTKNERMD